MTFTSGSFFLFAPAVFAVFYLTSDRWRWLVLLGSSYLFYCALRVPYLPAVLLGVTWVSYAGGLLIASGRGESARLRRFWGATGACLACLALIKYLPVLGPLREAAQGARGFPAGPLVTIGVSYFTFQAVSYLVDVYLEVVEPERHFGHYALYLAFFPKLLQGPIERAADLIPQLKKGYRFDYASARLGLTLFMWGLFKKLVLADRLALFVDPVFGNVHEHSGAVLVLASYIYALQIYFDFSGYTDMALGVARIFNLRLTQNFDNPYLATSVMEFWRRWHISFSRWILNYLFTPLQLYWRERGQAGTVIALMVTFVLSGLWHGASWNFLAWGALHGVYLSAGALYKPVRSRMCSRMGWNEKSTLVRAVRGVVTFNLVSLAWVFFRSESFSDALYIVGHLFTGIRGTRTYLYQDHLWVVAVSILVVLAPAFCRIRSRLLDDLGNRPWFVRWGVYYALTYGVFFLKIVDAKTQFAYFKF